MEGVIARAASLSRARARPLISRVREEAKSRELELAAAAVDDAGHVVASQRMDGAALGAMQLAIGLPLFVDGAHVGGVGASGGTAADDAECVAAAIRSLGFD